MDQSQETKTQTLLEQLCKSAIYYWPQVNRRVPSSYRSQGAYLPGITVCIQKYHVPSISTAPKKT